MNEEPSPIVFEEASDPLRTKVRLGSGGIFGLAVGFCAGLYYWPTKVGVLSLALLAAVVCAWAALQYGDRFWTEGVAQWMRWW
jgi:hypothetical protein